MKKAFLGIELMFCIAAIIYLLAKAAENGILF